MLHMLLAVLAVMAAVLAASQAPPSAASPRPAASQQSSELVIASPGPGTRTASTTAQISLLGAAANTLTTSAIHVVGSLSGAHSGRLEHYSTSNGASFLPDQPFDPGEVVTVSTGLDIAGARSGRFSFTVGVRLAVGGSEPLPALSTTAPGVDHFVSAPQVEPPKLAVSEGAASAGGDLFLTPKGSTGQPGPMIVAPDGHVIWFHPLAGKEAFDFNLQRLGDKQVLTWFQGVVVAAHGAGEDVIANRRYHVIAVLKGGNGFQPDLHEFQLLPSGVALVTSYQALHWDLAPVGGPVHGLVWDSIVQEIDVRTGLVEYEWHSLDHVGVALSVLPPPKPSNASHIDDYFHVNSIEQLPNGDLLVSGRNTSAAYEIDPSLNGTVVWELGGRRSSFTMGPGSSFWLQHDVRLLDGDTVTIFDDEASPVRAKPAQSRALVLHLDLATMTAEVAHAYDHDPPLLAAALGNVQTLPGGDLFVSWGTTPQLSEYSPGGAVVFAASLPSGDDSYRAFRYPWNGEPLTHPSLKVLPGLRGHEQLEVSWNGATGIAAWRVLGGSSATALHLLETAPRAGFQTGIGLDSSAPDVEVQALDPAGDVVGTSPVVARRRAAAAKR